VLQTKIPELIDYFFMVKMKNTGNVVFIALFLCFDSVLKKIKE